MGSGIPLSPSCDDWSCAALPVCFSGMPGAFVYFLGFLKGKVFWEVILQIFSKLFTTSYLVPPAGTR